MTRSSAITSRSETFFAAGFCRRQFPFLCILALALLAGQSLRAGTPTWNNTGTDFNTGTDWTTGVPGSGDTATFNVVKGTNPNLSVSDTILGLNFSATGASGYDLTNSSGAVLTLTNVGTTTGTAAINGTNTSGTNTISSALTLGGAAASQAAFIQAAGGTLVVNGNISSTTTEGLLISGAGTVVLGGTNSFTGSTSYTGGTLQLTNESALASSALGIAAGKTLQLRGDGAGTYATGTITTGTTLTIDADQSSSGVAGTTLTLGTISTNTAGTTTVTFTNGTSGKGYSVQTGTIGENAANRNLTVTNNLTNGGVLTVGQLLGNASTTITINGGGTTVFNGLSTGNNTVFTVGSSTTAETVIDEGALSVSNNTSATVSSTNTFATTNALAFDPAGGSHGFNSVVVQAGAALDYAATADAQLLIQGGGSNAVLTVTSGTATTGGTTYTTTLGGAIGSTTTSAEIKSYGAATTTTGAVKVNVYGITGVSPSSGTNTYTLITGGSGSTLNNATYSLGTVYNASNFTVGAIASTLTTVTAAITKQTALTSEYWGGGYTSANGATNQWAASNGSAASPSSNWVTSSSGGATSLTPGSTATINFSATGATGEGSMSLGDNMSILGLVSNDNTALLLNNDGYALTVGTGGITVGNTNSSAGSVTLNETLVLGGDQTWTNSSTNALNVVGNVSGAHNLTVAGTGNTNIVGQIATGAGTFTKSGTGTATLTGESTFTGATTISMNGGTLALSNTGGQTLTSTSGVTINSGGTLLFGANDTINHAATVTLAGGKISMQGLSGSGAGTGPTETMGALTLSAASSIDFGTGSGNTLVFASVTGLSGTNTLSVYNWSGTGYTSGGTDTDTDFTQDRLLFGTHPSSGDASDILFYSGGVGSTLIGTGVDISFAGTPTNEVAPSAVPEPSTYFGATCLLGLLGWRGRRRIQELVVLTFVRC